MDTANGLNSNQYMAHSIITSHLKAHLEGHQPQQLLMMVMGQAGTGKSTLLNTITSMFEQLKAPQLLATTALSGSVAAFFSRFFIAWEIIYIKPP